ncbi:MAG: anthranilate phosphoribosyltransferase [Thermodesulfobacteriota bacterium]
MLKAMIRNLVRGEDLAPAEMIEAMELILSGQARPSQTAAFLVALRLKGEKAEEIAAAAEVMRRYTPRISASDDVVVLDRDEINLDEETVAKTCSLDQGLTNTFNISTATALVAAGGGIRVAKYGSRFESTFCGSANVVTALGLNLDLTLTEVERCLEQIGLGFLYANVFLTPLRHPTRVREEIGVMTIFNQIQPLANPAGGQRQVLGVYHPEKVVLMGKVLKLLGCREALVVHGQDTLDEISITGPTLISHLKNGANYHYELVPEDLGLTRAGVEQIKGGHAGDNAKIIREILDGAPGPKRDVVLLNAAAVFLVADLAADLKQGLERAKEAIDSGRAKAKLNELIAFTAQCGVYQHKDVS